MSENILPQIQLTNVFCTLCAVNKVATKGQEGDLIYHVENLTFTSADVSTNKWLLFLQRQYTSLESLLCSLLECVVAAGVIAWR